jgi:hypothetical protein
LKFLLILYYYLIGVNHKEAEIEEDQNDEEDMTNTQVLNAIRDENVVVEIVKEKMSRPLNYDHEKHWLFSREKMNNALADLGCTLKRGKTNTSNCAVYYNKDDPDASRSNFFYMGCSNPIDGIFVTLCQHKGCSDKYHENRAIPV